MEGVETPSIIPTEQLVAINLWMSIGTSRSSIHYDPYHNLLCVVTGHKTVRLWSPKCSAQLYPKALSGEASNHSDVDFAAPNLSLHPRFQETYSEVQTVDLKPGDVLFIPEGWWHQVDSDSRTMAVNFWWTSNFSENLGRHTDAYYTRRLLGSLLVEEKSRRIVAVQPASLESLITKEPPTKRARKKKPDALPARLSEEAEVRAMLLLSAITAEAVTNKHSGEVEPLEALLEEPKYPSLESVLVALPTCPMRRIIYGMATKTPRTLEAMILHGLTPISAEILTRKLEEKSTKRKPKKDSSPADDDTTFYQIFYGVFSDGPDKALSTLVRHKEEFSQEAMDSLIRSLMLGPVE